LTPVPSYRVIVADVLRTGQLARKAGVNIQTLRYYERRRLLTVPPRQPSGQRAYPETAVGRIRAIKAAQRLGFTLNEIQELLSFSDQVACLPRFTDRAHAKLFEVESPNADLEHVRSTLHRALTAQCDSLTECSCGWTAQS
jgi:DNA-binding transcriptional MerR regulator